MLASGSAQALLVVCTSTLGEPVGLTTECYYGLENSQSSISTLSSSGVESSSSRAVLAVFKIGWPRLLKDVFAKTP